MGTRHQADFVHPLRSRAAAAQVDEPRREEEVEVAAELARRIRELAHDPVALALHLRESVPPWQRRTLRLLLVRLLGARLGRGAWRRAFGDQADPLAAPVPASPPRLPAASPSATAGDGAGSTHHEVEAELAADEVMARLSAVDRGPAVGDQGSNGGGRPLPSALRGPFERAFGWDLSSVRLHTGGPAAARTGAAGAAALTSGSDIFFAPHVDPESPGHRRALAHELAHVIQQQRGAGIAPPPWLVPRGGGVAARLSPAPVGPAQALPNVTQVVVDGEIGLGKSVVAEAKLAASAPATAVIDWSSALPGITFAPTADPKKVTVTAPAALAGSGGSRFKIKATLQGTASDAKESQKITLVEIKSAELQPQPPFGGTLSYPGGFPASTPPRNSVDPNTAGVTGNAAKLKVVTAPANRAFTGTLVTAVGATIANNLVTPGATTGEITARSTDDKTQSFREDKMMINPVPTGVSGFGAQFPAGPGLYGSFNTVQFSMSHGAMDNRPVAEMITKGPRNDFNIVPNNGWHTAPTMTFSAPANQWTDLNGTPVGHAKIDVNLYEGSATEPLPRVMIFNQTFHWRSWRAGSHWSTAIANGIHRRSLMKSGANYIFRTEQIFGGAAATFDHLYGGPPLITLSNVAATPHAPPAPAATQIAADGKATARLRVTSSVPGRKANWSIAAGGSLTVQSGGSNMAIDSGHATIKATTVAGETTFKAADSKFAHRNVTGKVTTVPVQLSPIAPSVVAPGILVSPISVTASPGGRTLRFSVDAAAKAAGVKVAPGTPGAAMAVTTQVTRPATYSGTVTLTAKDSVLTAQEQTTTIQFQATPPPAAP